MGGFASLLGHAASGFEQARQQDLARSFADEQNRRAMAGELLHTLALDPNQHPDVRNGALQSYLGLSQMPLNKQYNFSKEIQPLFDLMAKYRAAGEQARQQGPTVPPVQLQLPPQPGQAAGQATVTPGGTHAQQLPPGVAGPPQQVPNAPQINAPPRPLAMAAPAVQGPPPPPESLLAGVPEIAQNAGLLAGAQSGGALTGQIEARRQIYSQLPGFSNLPPETQAILLGGGSLLPLSRTVGTGGGYAGQLRAQGLPVPANIPDNQWVNERQLMGGAETFTPGAAPGEKALGGGQLGTPGQLTQQRQEIELPFYAKKVGMQLAKTIAAQNNEFGLAMQRGAYQDANNIFFKAQDDYMKRQGALRIMEENYNDALKGNQQAMVSMLFNHIGMTSGAVPGSRQSRATIEEAEASTPWVKSIISKWFHQDENGDYVFDGLKGGINLNRGQMDQMIDLAKQRVAVQKDQVRNYQNQLGGGGEFTPPSISAIGGGGRGAPKASQPPTQGAHQSFADWKRSQQGATP